MQEQNKKADWLPVILYILITFSVSFLSGLIIGFTSAINGQDIDINSPVLIVGSLVIPNLIITIVFLIIYYKRLKHDFKRITKKNIIYIVISAIVLIIANEIISRLFETLNIETTNQDMIINALSITKLPVLLAITFLAPFVEEMTFRYSLKTVFKNKIIFVIISALTFGLLHGIGIATILYVLIGTCLAIIYLKNDENIIVPISVHFLNNLIAALELLFLI